MEYGARIASAREFYELMCSKDFLPNTPCLVNAGRPLSMLSACFVLGVPDSMDGIFDAIKSQALIQKAGGGTGMAFSRLRGHGAAVRSTGKASSGPLAFMKVFDSATDSIKQSGIRRGANMGVLSVDRPDIFEFMACKKELDPEHRALLNRLSDSGAYSPEQLARTKQELLQTQYSNFNISIGISNAFIQAVKADADFDLRDPNSGATVRTVKAREIWDAIVEGAWQKGEPGVLFLEHPTANPLPGLGPIEASNPCFTGDTLILTTVGPQRIADLVGTPFIAIVDGHEYRSTERGAWSTGVKPVMNVLLEDGRSLRVTPNHRILRADASGNRTIWTEVQDLDPGDYIRIIRANCMRSTSSSRRAARDSAGRCSPT